MSSRTGSDSPVPDAGPDEDLPIIVGFDGSDSAHAALHWALTEAGRIGAAVRLLYVFEWINQVGVFAPIPPTSRLNLRDEAEQVLVSAVAAAAERRPDVPVDTEVVEGSAAAQLRDASRHARMLVVGHRGLGGFTGLLLGSVGVAVSAHAHCPVVVVRGGVPDPGWPVVVGVDASPQSQLATGYAFELAQAHGVGLTAVHAWEPPPVPWRDGIPPRHTDTLTVQADEQHQLAEVLAGWQRDFPGVRVTSRLIPARPGHALLDASRRAQLVVLGSRGHGGFRGLVLGSVSQQLLHHSACPVAVVRERTGALVEHG